MITKTVLSLSIAFFATVTVDAATITLKVVQPVTTSPAGTNPTSKTAPATAS